jgi:hypothetical protein
LIVALRPQTVKRCWATQKTQLNYIASQRLNAKLKIWLASINSGYLDVVRNLMRVTFTIWIFFLSFSAKGQELTFADLFSDAVRSLYDTSGIVYMDSSLTFYQTLSKFADRNGRVFGNINIREKALTSILFTKPELRAADKKMRQQSSIQWSVGLFSGSMRLVQDSIAWFTRYMSTPEFQRGERIYRHYYYFSQPVVIRAGTLAIFRVADMIQNSAGYDYLFFYEKTPNGWRRKMTLRSGAW